VRRERVFIHRKRDRRVMITYLLGEESLILGWTRWCSSMLEQTPSGFSTGEGEDSRRETSDLTVTEPPIVGGKLEIRRTEEGTAKEEEKRKETE